MVPCPFQTLCGVQPLGDEQPFLLAASGPYINSFHLKTGSLLSQWPPAKEIGQSLNGIASHGEEGRPAKRQKLDEDDLPELPREDTEESIDFISERKKGERRKPKVETSTLPNVSHIVVTSNGKTAICVTGEDKAVTVFDLNSSGVMDLKSQR